MAPDLRCLGQVRRVRCVEDATAPVAKGDVRERSAIDWTSAAAHFVEVKLFADQAQRALAEARARLVGLVGHTSEAGGGVTVTRYWKQGAIDYKKIQELHLLDLAQYRGAAREETRVTIG